METINELINALYLLISVCCIIRGILLLNGCMSEEKRPDSIKKLKNLLVYYILSLCVTGIVDIITSYFMLITTSTPVVT